MENTLNLPLPLVSVSWLSENLNHPDLVVFDASMEKVGQAKQDFASRPCIQGARFMNLKRDFSDPSSNLPNTVLPPKEFELLARKLGINQSSKIVIYDQHGIYTSPRAWWLFQLMGHTQVSVLNGGLPAWEAAGYSCQEPSSITQHHAGNFAVHFQSQWLAKIEEVLEAVDRQSHCMVDARTADRFYARIEEPRKGLRSGHIPSSFSLPFVQVLENSFIKPKAELQQIIEKLNPKGKPFICSCGSGITASILALALHVAEVQEIAVYDGSWSEWGMPSDRPVSKQ